MAVLEDDGGKIKPAGYRQHYTLEQAKEIARCENDVIYFIENYVMLKHPKMGAMRFKLYDFQKRLLQTYMDNRMSIAMLSRQCGKALPLDTRLPTPVGWTTMGDIKVGDTVFGDDGKPTTVVAKSSIMVDHDIFTIRFDNGETIDADAEHLWSVSSTMTHDTVVITTRELIPLLEHHHAGGYDLYIRATEPVDTPEAKFDNDPYRVGYRYNKSAIPEKYLRGSVEQRVALLQGIMDVSGNVGYDGICELSCGGQTHIDIVYELVASLGIKVSVDQKVLRFASPRFDLFHDPVRKRAQKDYGKRESLDRFYIRGITLTDSRPVQCIQVDNDSHLFLCGKSWIPTHNTQTAAAYLLWWAIFKDEQYILIASKDQGGADEIMDRLWYAYEELPWWIKPGVRKNDVKTKFFDNGSKIVTKATTPSAGRGLSVSLLYLDEFAFVTPRIASDFWTAVAPTLSTGGDCIITSTPNTDEDKFAQIWFAAKPSPLSDKWEDKLAKRYANEKLDESDVYETIYETDEAKERLEARSMVLMDDDEDEESEDQFVSFHAHWTSVPVLHADGSKTFRGEKFKRAQIRSGLTTEEWMREFECSFISGGDTLISGAKIASFRSTVRDPRFVDKWGCRWYEPILPNTPYAVVMDPSGDGVGDDAAIQVWEIPTLKQVAEWNDAEADQDEQARMLRRVLMRIHTMQENNEAHDGVMDIYYSVERNAIGIGIIRAIEHMGEENFPGWFIDASEVSLSVRGESNSSNGVSKYRGLLTSNATKRRYAQDFKQFIERNLFMVRSRFLSSQLKQFVKTGPSWAAAAGSKDDLVMSCVLMCHLIDELRFQEPDLDDYIRPVIDDYDENDENHPDNIPMLPIV